MLLRPTLTPESKQLYENNICHVVSPPLFYFYLPLMLPLRAPSRLFFSSGTPKLADYSPVRRHTFPPPMPHGGLVLMMRPTPRLFNIHQAATGVFADLSNRRPFPFCFPFFSTTHHPSIQTDPTIPPRRFLSVQAPNPSTSHLRIRPHAPHPPTPSGLLWLWGAAAALARLVQLRSKVRGAVFQG